MSHEPLLTEGSRPVRSGKADHLMEQIAAPENLLSAWRAVRGNIPRYRRERSSGPDGLSLDEFERELALRLGALRQSLMKGRYQPQPPALIKLPKPNGGHRQIAILSITDRVAQRAAQQILEPIWEPGFLPCSYGFRPGRSTRQAIDQARGERRTGNEWVVDGDIAACFDSLDHALLLKRIEAHVQDMRVIELLKLWLDQGILEHGMPEAGSGWLREHWEKLSGGVKQGTRWVLETLNPLDGGTADWEDLEGYPGFAVHSLAEDNFSEDRLPIDDTFSPGGYYPQGIGEPYRAPRQREMRREGLQQLIAGGLMLGSNWLRPTFQRLGSAMLRELQTPEGRVLLKKGALAGGGALGAAVGLGAAAYLVYHQVATSPVGVLQGSPLSPLMANIYLHPFDLAMTRQRYHLVRFADDWVVCCPSELSAERAYNEAVIALSKLHLKVNPEKTRILPPAAPVEWLGERIEPITGESHRRAKH